MMNKDLKKPPAFINDILNLYLHLLPEITFISFCVKQYYFERCQVKLINEESNVDKFVIRIG